jgi:hypothetical protein
MAILHLLFIFWISIISNFAHKVHRTGFNKTIHNLGTSCFVAAVLGLGPVCYCCILRPSNVPSRTSVLSGFIVPHCPGQISRDCVPAPCHFCTVGHSPADCGKFLPLSTISLKTFLLRRSTAARRNTFLQAAANFHRDPQSPLISSFVSVSSCS